MNRVAQAIEGIRVKAEALDPAAREALDADMAVDFAEHFAYQQAQAQAHAAGRISTDEALLIYAALGEIGSAANGGWASSTDLATKVAVTLSMGELLKRR